MRTLIEPRSHQANDAPDYVRERAITKRKKIIKIVWDEADGYPQHAWGYVQWSVRPYEPWYGCDGTTDANIHLIALGICQQLGLDYASLYAEAYPDIGPWTPPTDEQYWQEAHRQTIRPMLSDLGLCSVIHDLHEINNHSLANLLEQKFTALGFDVSDYWLRNPNRSP